jgi:hypothetical protein
MTDRDATLPTVDGSCPWGCGRTLFLGSGGQVTCSFVGCPRPAGVADILNDREHEHVVTLRADTWSLQHPLREQLDDLEECPVRGAVAGLDGPPHPPGRYRVTLVADGVFEWELLDG